MQTTVDIDDELYTRVQELAGYDIPPEDLVREALQTYVYVQAAKRLAALGCPVAQLSENAG